MFVDMRNPCENSATFNRQEAPKKKKTHRIKQVENYKA